MHKGTIFVGDTVFCRGLFMQTVTGDVVDIRNGVLGKRYLCRIRIEDQDQGYSYDTLRWRYIVSEWS